MSLRNADSKVRAGQLSITARLTLLYALSAFGLLFVSMAFLFWTLRNGLDRKNEEFVTDKVRELQTIITEQKANPDAMEREIVRETTVSSSWRYFARTLDVRGETLMETPGMEASLPSSAFPPPVVVPDASILKPKRKSIAGRSYMVIAAEASKQPEGQARTRRIQFALDVTQDEILVADYRRRMTVVLAVGLLFLAAAGAVATRKGLRPLQDITRVASLIRVTRLHERVGKKKWPRELAALAGVFDEMLGRLEDSFTRLSQFSADLAHELRTPINNLVVETSVALSRDRTAEEYREVLESNIEEYNRLSDMIESLLFLARADADRAPLQIEQLDARAEIEAVREFHEAVAAERGIEVTCEGNAVLQADQMLFRRAVSNVVSNALAHTSSGGCVRLSVKMPVPEVIEVLVADTGIGIAPEHLPRIFDRFYRVDPSRSQQPHGTGLGLAIVRSILQLHGGSAAVASEPGKGTTVSLRFPQPSRSDQITEL